jgi:hypothetical protein
MAIPKIVSGGQTGAEGPRWIGFCLTICHAEAGVRRDGKRKMEKSSRNILWKNPHQLQWLEDNAIEVLNVADPRDSKEPGVATFVVQALDAVFGF